jgi:acyl-coenzyme A synthetase/AMP-(fatty) acid ligase
LVFALLKSGAVQILIDPGMGKRNVLQRLKEISPHGMIAPPTVHAIRRCLKKCFPAARFNITTSTRSLWGAMPLEEIRRRGARQASNFRTAPTTAESPAAIIFTSGSTGPAKGVLYRHGNFDHQVAEISNFYDIKPGQIDLPCFALFGLFNGAMGVTSIFPKMDFSRPARVNPRNIVAAVEDWQPEQAFASPAVWNVVGRYCEQTQTRLSSLRRVMSAGAPVTAEILSCMKACIGADGDMHTPYGATEALPVASIPATEVLAETDGRTQQGAGVCVGRRFGGVNWRVIRIVDGSVASIDETVELPRGEIGELIVQGPVVTTEYVTSNHANAATKIRDDSRDRNGDIAANGFWHRMGDVGYLDDQDRFWFCGRMSQRVTTADGPMFTVPTAAIFNRHADVFRSALVGLGPRGNQTPAVVVEPRNRLPRAKRKQLVAELKNLAQSSPHTASIRDILVRRSLPVDVRHNVKIDHEQLARWAAKRLRRKTS